MSSPILKTTKIEICEDNEEPEDVALQKQLQEKNYLEEIQEELQDDQPYFSLCLFNLVVVPNDEGYKSSSLQEAMESSHQEKNDKTEDGS